METQNNQETKLCKYCQSEIPKKAKICPNCRKKQGGKAKCIIIAVAIILIIGVSTGGQDEETNKESETVVVSGEQNGEDEQKTEEDSAENTEETSETENYLSTGSSFEKNGLKVTINEASIDFQDYEDEYGLNTPEEGMKYIMASFTFENNGDSDAYVSIYDFKCYADNTTCEQVFTLGDNDFINTNLSSGRNVSFETYYSVPIDAQSIELEYETNIWTGEKVIIKIQ